MNTPNTPEKELLIRWVKASERLPEKGLRRPARSPYWAKEDPYIYSYILLFESKVTIAFASMYLDSAYIADFIKDWEWLEELPPQPAQHAPKMEDAEERDIIYAIAEHWDNAKCGISKMIEWLKEYRAKALRSQQEKRERERAISFFKHIDQSELPAGFLESAYDRFIKETQSKP